MKWTDLFKSVEAFFLHYVGFFGIRNLLTKNACLKLSNQLIDRINRLAELEKNVARQRL